MTRRRASIPPRRGRALLASTAALLLTFPLGACSGTNIGYPDDLQLLATSPASTEPDEAVEGRLGTGLDLCVGLFDENGEGPVVSWPRGTTWLEDRTGLRLPDGRELLIGDLLAASGQTVAAGPDEQATCPRSDDVLMLSTIAASR